MTRVWLRDEQKVECADISLDLIRFIRDRHAEARSRMLAGYPGQPPAEPKWYR